MTTSRATKGVPIEAIQRVPLFADLNKHEVQEIARLFKEHRFSKGETIVQERSAGNTLFLIESGEAGVFIGGIGRTTMRSPDYFGEVALFDEGTRMATIRLQRSRLLRAYRPRLPRFSGKERCGRLEATATDGEDVARHSGRGP